MNGGPKPPAKPNFTLCEYFDQAGRWIERIYIVNDEGEAATEEVRELVRSGNFERVLDRMMAEASTTGATTSTEDAALALNALLLEVEDGRLPVAKASEIVAIGLNFRKAVSITEVMPALEANFGGKAVSWARGIFRGLNLGPPGVH